MHWTDKRAKSEKKQNKHCCAVLYVLCPRAHLSSNSCPTRHCEWFKTLPICFVCLLFVVSIPHSISASHSFCWNWTNMFYNIVHLFAFLLHSIRRMSDVAFRVKVIRAKAIVHQKWAISEIVEIEDRGNIARNSFGIGTLPLWLKGIGVIGCCRHDEWGERGESPFSFPIENTNYSQHSGHVVRCHVRSVRSQKQSVFVRQVKFRQIFCSNIDQRLNTKSN